MVSPAQRAISLILTMAEQGEIDPWDVQVIEVIDRFLVELRLNDFSDYFTELRSTDRMRYESDLSESGQAFLYASMLVLYKADTLVRDAIESHAPEEEFDPAYEEGIANGTIIPLPTNLERQLRRRAVARPPEQRRVTLQELVEQLELMALALDAPRDPRPKHRTPKPFTQRQAVRSISQLAHQENLAEVAAALGQYLEHEWRSFQLAAQEWLDFDHLVSFWHRSPANIFSHGVDRVGVFWALLFLSAQGKIELDQTDFYGAIQLRLLESLDSFGGGDPLVVSVSA